MKLRKLSYLKYKLTKIELIKSRIYQNSLKSFDLTETYLKKAINIISQYHMKNKTIFFIGVNKKIQNKYKYILKTTRHLFLPDKSWTRGFLTNKAVVSKHVKNFFLLKKSPDLIVVFDEQSQFLITKEAYKLKIPVIAFNTKKFLQDDPLYQICSSSQKAGNTNNNLIVLLLNSIFTKKNVQSKNP